MVLENKGYVPTLAVRASEMNGLEYLPGATKDRMAPCFLLAPWANSNSLARTIVRLEQAFPNRPYFLDIDTNYQLTNPDSVPQYELEQLKIPTNYFENWTNFVQQHRNIWPCVQTRGQNSAEIQQQIQAFQRMERNYCLRIGLQPFPANFDAIIDAFAAAGAADFVIILEGGWIADPLTLSSRFAGIIGESLQRINADVPVVLSCTSMPKFFTDFNSEAPVTVPFTNRRLVDQVGRNSNRARVIFGDWGSTRPREASGFASRPLDRIDYPTDSAWLIARNKEDDWSFRDAALAIVESPQWDGNLGIWGEEMIQQTTVNEELGIDTPQKNVAARVNIHLHRQAFFGQPRVDPVSFDEDWQD